MKKLFAILMMLTLVLSMAAVPAFADETGSITINNVPTAEDDDGTIYNIYRLLDLPTYNLADGKYSYVINDSWVNFFKEGTGALDYVSVENGKYVTWSNAKDDEDTVGKFAQLALAYAKEAGINPTASSKNGDMTVTTDSQTKVTSGKFTNLPLGYYLVDSNVGALCGLTTTNPNASINAKNGRPTIDKQVQEDSTKSYGYINTADIGQLVYYQITINVHAGAQNYVLHDMMADGLTFKEIDRVEHVVPGTGTHEADPDMYTVTTTGLADDCDFEISFTDEFYENVKANDKIIIYYHAMLNRNAVIAEAGNPNEAVLTFGEPTITDGKFESNRSTTTTYTYAFDLVKTDSQNVLLDGAEFKIYDAAEGGNEIAVVLMDDGVTYRRARADETGTTIIVKDGKVRIVGFDNGTYYLEETKEPQGYNKLTSRQSFTISDSNRDAIFNGDIFSTGSGVHVVNKTGTILPETGGFGTTMFILIGGLAVLAAGVLLFVNKRMSQIAE